MASGDDTLDTVRITREFDELIPAERALSWMQLLFPKGSVSRWTDAAARSSVDVLGPTGELCEVKSWAVASATRHVFVTMLLSDEGDAAVSNPALMGGRERVGTGRGERRTGESDVDRVAHDLRRARALRELSEMETKRAVWRAHGLGLSQRQIGDLVGRSQPDVGRTIKKVDADLGCMGTTPREIALRRLVGEYTSAEMMARLLTLTYTYGEADPSPVGGGYVPGTWDELRLLRDDDLISEAEWEELFHTVMGPEVEPAGLVLPSDDE